MKRRGFVALFLIICLSLVFISCSSEVQNGNGQVVSLSFEGPGVLAYKEGKRVALVGHTYTVDNYKVYANYSNGYREDVTQVAKVTSNDEYATVGKGNTLTFTNVSEDNKTSSKDGNAYSLTVEYAGITLPVTAWAYAAGEPIDGLKNPKKVFYKGELLSSFAGASMLDKDGNYSYSSLLPYDGSVLFLDKTGDMYTVSLSDKYTFSGDEVLMYYVSLSEEGSFTSVTFINGFEVVSYEDSDIKSINLGLFAKYPKKGDTINYAEFAKTYFKGQRGSITLKNGANFRVQMVDDDGTQNADYTFSFVVKNSEGQEKNSGEFDIGDKLTVTVKYKNSDIIKKCERTYTVSSLD